MEVKKHKVPATANDTKGGRSAMSQMNPQKPEIVIAIKPTFKGITHRE